MVHAYRLLIKTMADEFGECYPLHLGVTEAGDGVDGRIKSAVGIGTLLEDGLGDTIRVSLTEDPELEIPVCMDLVKRYASRELGVGSRESGVGGRESGVGSRESGVGSRESIPAAEKISYDPFSYQRRETFAIDNIGGRHVPVVMADLSKIKKITREDLKSIGYSYDAGSGKWNISDLAADYVFTGHQKLDFELPGGLKQVVYPATWKETNDSFPIFSAKGFNEAEKVSNKINFVMIDCFNDGGTINDFTDLDYFLSAQNELARNKTVLCLSSLNKRAMPAVRRTFIELMDRGIKNPVINITDSDWKKADEHLLHFATEAGALLLEGMGDGICLGMTMESYNQSAISHRSSVIGHPTAEQFINNIAFTILQATRTRISKTEYISCPSCGRTLFDLQETTAKIRAVTHHLKGVKIAIMGCIVNGPGEMADADFGYVGSGPGKVTLYRGKEIVKRNVNTEVAVEELINLLRENDAWVEQ
jgi:(E)-4-hydroxy-3-methylbut-2-enyl-diphosphate synthase